jgi:imidazolonepropionase-like amidohydrolase
MSNNGKLIAIVGGTLLDGTGRDPIKNATVLFDESIITVGPSEDIKIPSKAQEINGAGMTIMPGLIDAHIHISGRRTRDRLRNMIESDLLKAIRCVVDVNKALEMGFTTLRDVGSTIGLSLRTAINEGTVPGPRIVTAHKIISQTAGHGDVHYLPINWVKDSGRMIVDGPDECRRAARLNIREGVDLLKLCTTGGVMSQKDVPGSPQFTVDEIKAVVEEGHRVGIKVAAHAQGAEGIKNAIISGVDTIEHGTYIDDEGIQMMIDEKRIFVPTLAINWKIITEGEKFNISPWAMSKAEDAGKVKYRNTMKVYKAGVKIAMGTDFSSPPMTPLGENAIELWLMVREGMKPMDAIVSATQNAAEAADLDKKLGTLEKGKLADVVIVDGDPLKDIKLLQDKDKIKMVFKGGNIMVDRRN